MLNNERNEPDCVVTVKLHSKESVIHQEMIQRRFLKIIFYSSVTVHDINKYDLPTARYNSTVYYKILSP